MANQLKKLREDALRVHIDPKRTVGHAATLSSVIEVLSAMRKSYENYVAIELEKDDVIGPRLVGNPTLKKGLIQSAELLVVDVDFGSYDSALSPAPETVLFTDEIHQRKRQIFEGYKKLVAGNMADLSYMQNAVNRYTERERRAVYLPLFTIADRSDYKVNIKDSRGKVLRSLIVPAHEKRVIYAPPIIRNELPMPAEKTVMAFIKIDAKAADQGKLTQKSIKEIQYLTEVQEGTHPYAVSHLLFNDLQAEFHLPIIANARIEEDLIYLEHPPLDIMVWGETRQEVEEAFKFALYSLLMNFYFAEDKSLTPKAQELKLELFRLIKSIEPSES